MIKRRYFILTFFILVIQIFLILFISIAKVSAEASTETIDMNQCQISVDINNTQDFLSQIPKINSEIRDCDIIIPNIVEKLIGDGKSLVEINMNNKSIEEFFVSLENKKFVGIEKGSLKKPRYVITTDEDTFNSIIVSKEPFGKSLSLYKEGKITIKGGTVWNKIKLFFARIFSRFI